MIYFKTRKEKVMKRRFLLSSILIISMLFVTGCGKEEGKEDTTSTSSQVTEALQEKKTEDEFRQELEKADQKYRDAIADYSIKDYGDTISASIHASNGGTIAEAAEFSTQFFDSRLSGVNSYMLLVQYDDPAGWTVSWDTSDNKTGFLMNTLTNYTEENVTIDGLYSWKEGK
jgi:hypothetical protein